MTVEDYLQAAPEPQRSTLLELRSRLAELLPEAEETISYGMPAFKMGGRAVAGYAWFEGHCSYFPHSGSVLPALEGELTAYRWSKGTLRFAVDDPLPTELLHRLVEVRLAELGGG